MAPIISKSGKNVQIVIDKNQADVGESVKTEDAKEESIR